MVLEYYDILEISVTDDKDVIKKAYRKMALKYHPDRNPNDKEAEEMFKKVNEAYEVLSDDNKREIYKKYGKEGLKNGGYSGFSGADFSDLFGDLGSIFGSAFGGGFSQRSKKQTATFSEDLEFMLDLNFKEAVFGCKKKVSVEYKSYCKDCNATGAKDGKLQECVHCKGRGQIFVQQGFMAIGQTCPYCRGSGQSSAESCKSCKGQGFEILQDDFEVDIPEGVDNGNILRVSGRGNLVGKDKKRGTLYVQLAVEEDDHFIRDGDNIFVEVPVFFTSIALGVNIKVPTLRGEVELKLPQGTKDQEQFIFKNEGVRNVRSGRKGAFVAVIKTIYPKKLSERQQELLKQLHESFGGESEPHKGIFENICDKIKHWITK
ncbi:molecular chaperone DnaJ [Helicobacter sp. faydin-H20]|uniref:molecular chaperone DnaJ n=1 Tax=Helicobacter anatolicus TaxID=2905874 RepID=UPI001E345333|nr:molecular chaperone DnaJ [Helicobacter anatolicus]MCE3037363.1 molecular chaperone DnaJ [Helicobacter anatolicus]